MRKRNKQKKRKSKFILFFLFLLLIILIFFTPLFTIKSVEVNNCIKLKPEVILQQSGVKIGDHLFRINKQKIEQNLVHKGSITSCIIKRKLPDRLIIDIKENVPIAYIEKDHLNFIVYGQGSIKNMTEGSTDKTLIDLKGIEVAKITDDINLFKDPKLKTVFSNLKKSAYFNNIKTLDVSNPQNVVVMLKDGTTIKLGKIQQMDQSVKVSEKLIQSIRTNKIKAKEVNIENLNYPIIKKIS